MAYYGYVFENSYKMNNIPTYNSFSELALIESVPDVFIFTRDMG